MITSIFIVFAIFVIVMIFTLFIIIKDHYFEQHNRMKDLEERVDNLFLHIVEKEDENENV